MPTFAWRPPARLRPATREALAFAIDLHRTAELLRFVPQQVEAQRLRRVLLLEVDRLWPLTELSARFPQTFRPAPTPAKRNNGHDDAGATTEETT